MEKTRLDVYLVNNKKVESRNLATKLIEDGKIMVNSIIITKNNYGVNYTDKVEILENERYVSRGAYKLLKGIHEFKPELKDKIALDIGSSTGGFTQVLLDHDVRKVYCVDVGTDQLHEKIKNNKKVVVYEQTNFKDVVPTYFYEPIEFICCDVSFISIKQILKKIIELNFHNIEAIFLLKPQFEVGKEIIDKTGGVVKDHKLHEKVINDFKEFCKLNNIEFLNICESPITGAKLNNIEFLTHIFIK
ncbi:TlyA family RNA methyltransferase [Malacoplasma iowae]|uniref:TlyA family RNA methyltransferase n=1 Tax=Malacoplasma iowae TaxID=2116 RepID=UPI00022C62E3|nr:TlyA family RNA methyltransferase [Malacoplasma iowae]EGZ30970.1 hemolysin [Malacoplasma iowae 695]